MSGGEVFNVINDSNCSGALTLASTTTNGFNMTGGYIHGCVGINQQAGATGLIKINNSSNVNTQVVGNHSGIRINNVIIGSTLDTSTALVIGILNDSNNIYPFIRSDRNYYAIDIATSTNKGFVMLSGRLRSFGKSDVYTGSNVANNFYASYFTSKEFVKLSSGTGYYDALWRNK